ncbi:hypothetical protein GCM10009716_40340 [Streptomyces sodiiphilus]|uniref:Restriction endonuclease type IV Mrr domain-containing protein n=1 Tax=Streptomyces sodiiphilus TaxID=226217 RepID=A0ABN2PQU9_9ACTN
MAGRVGRRETLGGAGVLVALLIWVDRAGRWPLLLGAVALSAAGAAGWWLWRAGRRRRRADRQGREEDHLAAGQRSLPEMDAMSRQDFARCVAWLCRRDGCTRVQVSGRPGDLVADVTGRLPDGRLLVVQCAHDAPGGSVPRDDMQKLVGTARLHHRADVALFVTTCRFGKPAQDLAAAHGIVAVNRDLLELWNDGTPLEMLIALGGAGQGDRRHRARWKRAYGA